MKAFLTAVKLAPMAFLKFPLFITLSYLSVWLAWLFSPIIAAYSVISGKNTFGGPLSYLFTHNATLDGGIDQGVPGYVRGLTGFKLWWQRTCWVCRNPAYKFRAVVLGLIGPAKVIFEADTSTKADPHRWAVLENNGTRLFEWRQHIYISENWYLKVWLGWTTSTRGGYHMVKNSFFIPKRKK